MTPAEIFSRLGINPDTVNFGVHFVSAEEIRELNRHHRGKDKVTDVLSFPTIDFNAGEQTIELNPSGILVLDFEPNLSPELKPTRENFPLDYNRKTKRVELGDIIINADEPNPEFLTAHGLLHLLGYHH